MILKMLRVVSAGVMIFYVSVGIASFADPTLQTYIARNWVWWLAVPFTLAIAIGIIRSTRKSQANLR
jgi:dipeptide/tripeptide permease